MSWQYTIVSGHSRHLKLGGKGRGSTLRREEKAQGGLRMRTLEERRRAGNGAHPWSQPPSPSEQFLRQYWATVGGARAGTPYIQFTQLEGNTDLKGGGGATMGTRIKSLLLSVP